MDQTERNFSFGKSIIYELLTSRQFAKHTGKPKQLATIGIIGEMEEGKSTLMNQLNLWSDADVKIKWDDKSRIKLKQAEIDEFTKIRHIWEGRKILLLIGAHRYFLLPKDIRAMCKALVWVSLPPPWEMQDVAYLQAFFGMNKIQFPPTPYTALIVWRHWVNKQMQWGWFSWKDIPDHMADWMQIGFQQEGKRNRMQVPYVDIDL